jgi:uncharacterized protein with LGFP repeats
LWGRIKTKYLEIGEASSACGYPVADQTGSETHREGRFENGSIVWDKGAGTTVTC